MNGLSKRLEAIASLVPPGSTPVDVGTDHGRLPITLIQRGICPRVYAADVRPGPLAHARENAAAAGTAGQIRFYLSDGLQRVPPGYDTVILAGMGGITIEHILESAPIEARGAVFLIQPQSKRRHLYSWLGSHGYACSGAQLVRDGGFLYLILQSAYTGRQRDVPDAEACLPFLLLKEDPLLPEYFAYVCGRLERIIAGREAAEGNLDVSGYRQMLNSLRKEGAQYGLC